MGGGNFHEVSRAKAAQRLVFAKGHACACPFACVPSMFDSRIVRHPMYFGAVISILFMPLALGAYWSVPVFALIIPVIGLRILNEETILPQELAGYPEYCSRTCSRLIPGCLVSSAEKGKHCLNQSTRYMHMPLSSLG
jgi:protein-S-isoprenylcysteine O-methyltransferase Ste14